MEIQDTPFQRGINNNSSNKLLSVFDQNLSCQNSRRDSSTPDDKLLIDGDIEGAREHSQIVNMFVEYGVLEQSMAIEILARELQGKGQESQEVGSEDLVKEVYQQVSKGDKFISFKQFTEAIYLLDVYNGMTTQQVLAHQQQQCKPQRFPQGLSDKSKSLKRSIKSLLKPSYQMVNEQEETKSESCLNIPTTTPSNELSGDGVEEVDMNAKKGGGNMWNSVLKSSSKLGSSFKQISKNMGKRTMGKSESDKTSKEIGGSPIDVDIFSRKKQNSWFSTRRQSWSNEGAYSNYDAYVKED